MVSPIQVEVAFKGLNTSSRISMESLSTLISSVWLVFFSSSFCSSLTHLLHGVASLHQSHGGVSVLKEWWHQRTGWTGLMPAPLRGTTWPMHLYSCRSCMTLPRHLLCLLCQPHLNDHAKHIPRDTKKCCALVIATDLEKSFIFAAESSGVSRNPRRPLPSTQEWPDVSTTALQSPPSLSNSAEMSSTSVAHLHVFVITLKVILIPSSFDTFQWKAVTITCYLCNFRDHHMLLVWLQGPPLG